MKLVNFDKWGDATSGVGGMPRKLHTGTSDDSDTRYGHYWGVAIGPRSDEGRCLVGDVLIQSGRPFPLRGPKFNVEALRPASVNATLAIKSLQLALLEDPAELVAEFCRPNGEYFTPGAVAVTAAAGYVPIITVPFVGRRQARFQVVTAAPALNYRLYGLRYNLATRTVKATLLREELAAAPDADDTLGFYLGGTNEAECWDALRLDADSDADTTVSADVETIGEIGAR